MTDPRKIAEDIEAGGGATVEQRRTLARAYLALVSDLPVVIEAAEEQAREEDRLAGLCMSMQADSRAYHEGEAERIRGAVERLRALGGGT